MWQNRKISVGKTQLSILAIGFDENTLMPGKAAQGGAIHTLQKYGCLVRAFYAVTFTKDQSIPSPVKISENVFSYPTRSLSKLLFFKDAFRVASELHEREKCDLIYTQDCFAAGLVGYLLKRKYNLPLCFCFHGDTIDNSYWINERLRNRFFNIMGKWLIKKGDAFRVVSSSEEKKLINMGVAKERIWNLVVIQDFTRFLNTDGNKIRCKYTGSNGKSKIILFIGRLVEQKDLPTLLNAMAIILRAHPDAILLLVGQGRLLPELHRMAIDLGIEKDTVFVGSIPDSEIPDHYAACDVFVLSSVYEGNARVLSEAAAAAKPIVATDVSGTRDTVIDGVTGFIVELKNPQHIANRVTQLLDNPSMAKEMGLKARQHVLNLYSEGNLLPCFKDMWEKTVDRYRSQKDT